MTTTFTTVEERIVWTATEDPSYQFVTLRPTSVTLSGGGGGAVDSVNGETGVVVLDAADVGAATAADVSSAVSAHAGASDPHGDRAYSVQRANHTGTQAQSTVTDLVTDLAGKAATSHSHAASDVTSGTVATARLGSGTADSTTFLRGDQTWATPAGGGAVATDTIWDAAGDLAVGTGADTAAKLAKGTRGHALVTGASTLEWAQITPDVVAMPLAADDWLPLFAQHAAATSASALTPGSSATNTNSRACYLPFYVGHRIGVAGLGVDVSVGNAGGSAVVRMGVHVDNAAGRPGAVVAGTDTTGSATAAAKELTFSEVFLDPGWYHAVMVFQSLDTAGTNPSVRALGNVGSTAPRTSVPSGANHGASLTATVAGALADNPTVTIGSIFCPCMWLKVSTP